MQIRRTRILTAAMALSLILPIATVGAFSHAQEMKPQTAGEKYKNIKVLKDLPADQLIPVMHKYNDALGVKCDACHVIKPDHSGFELDEKPMKKTAREMIKFVKDLSKNKALDKKASCFMCHHGSAEPALEPMK